MKVIPQHEPVTSGAHYFSFSRTWPLLLIGAMWLAFFALMITGNTICGFRDSAYLYYPYFQWLDQVWAAGEIPLWNPYCGAGYPVVADGSSSVFYPGKLIFFCRFLSFDCRYGIYVAGHVLIAAYTTYWLMRHRGTGMFGATLAAIGYAFGGSVLFQTTNVIYLVSASWLPAALLCVRMLVQENSWRWAILGGVFCSLMILGGDPHTVFNVGLVGLAGIAGVARSRWRERIRLRTGAATIAEIQLPEIQSPEIQLPEIQSPELLALAPGRGGVSFTGAFARLSLLVVCTSVLAAVQLLPSFQRANTSVRSEYELPRTVYEAPGFSGDEIARGLLGAPVTNSHHDHLYQFSQPPWTLAELVYPNFSGRAMPLHMRWTDAIPGSDRMWTPSLYAGCLMFLLAIGAMRLRGKDRRRVWWTRLIFFFAVGSFGWYGIGWLAHEIGGPNALPNVGAPTGGLYWLMVVALPKYVTFRYPAKLFIFAALGISVLAGINLERVMRSSKLIKRYALCLIAISVIGFFMSRWLIASPIFDQVPTNSLFGPFQRDDCIAGLSVSLLQVLLIGAAVFFVGIGCFKKERSSESGWAGGCLLLICILDLGMANHDLVPQVAARHYLDKDLFATQLIQEHVGMGPPVIGFDNRSAAPESWPTTASLLRLQSVFSWQKSQLESKHHLLVPVIRYQSFASVESRLESEFYERRIEPLPDLVCLATIDGRPLIGARIDDFGPNRIVVRVRSDEEDCLMFLQQFFNSGWRAKILSNETRVEKKLTVEPSTRGFIKVGLPNTDGEDRLVEFSYRPTEFFVGAWISTFAWAGVMGFGAFGLALLFFRDRVRLPPNR